MVIALEIVLLPVAPGSCTSSGRARMAIQQNGKSSAMVIGALDPPMRFTVTASATGHHSLARGGALDPALRVLAPHHARHGLVRETAQRGLDPEIIQRIGKTGEVALHRICGNSG